MVNVPDDVEVADLPFTHARIKRMVREHADEGQYVRSNVYHGLNLLLGEIAEEIIEQMMDTNAAYVEKHHLDAAARKYEKLKNEEAGSHQTEAEKRYEQLKEEAKEEFVRKHQERDSKEDEEKEDGFVTH